MPFMGLFTCTIPVPAMFCQRRSMYSDANGHTSCDTACMHTLSAALITWSTWGCDLVSLTQRYCRQLPAWSSRNSCLLQAPPRHSSPPWFLSSAHFSSLLFRSLVYVLQSLQVQENLHSGTMWNHKISSSARSDLWSPIQKLSPKCRFWEFAF